MFILADIPSQGLVWGGIFTVVCILVCAGWITIAVLYSEPGAAGWGFAALAVVIIVAVAFYWPFKHDYHHWVDKRGVVQTVNKRIVSDGNNIHERFVIRFVNGGLYGVDDTRAAQIKHGDVAQIRCKKDHQWFQPYEDDGWVCRWAGGQV